MFRNDLSSLVLYLEYVNALELQTDLRSITDRAATTLLWTELLRGHVPYDFYPDRECHVQDILTKDI